MKISIDWLKDFVEIKEDPKDLDHLLTMGGLEVEGLEEFETIEGGLKGLVIGEVLEREQHPNADKLSLTKVDIGGEEPSPIVCGAPNVAAGQKVIVATVGATLYPSEGEPFKIKKAKIRGEVSLGMICAEDEIGLGKGHDGIMVLDTDLPNSTPASEYFDIKSDHVLEIGLTPNRVDAASHLGVARDLSSLLKRPINLPDISGFKIDNQSLPIGVEVEKKEACLRYSGLTISGLEVKTSPEWLQNRLKSIGLAPINNVVDATNYILHGLGQPLHAFDAEKIKGNKILVKTVAAGTKFVTLDEEERELVANDLMICNSEEPMCIAGVFGGLHSGVTEGTTSIFLESACFDPAFVRKTSQVHGLKTDSSFRFERGTDPNMPVFALKAAAMLIKEVAGGEVSSDIVDIYPEPVANFEVTVKYKNVDRLIGVVIDREEIKAILESLEMEILSSDEEKLTVSIPPYRVDVQREADVIEDILRIYGYEKIEPAEALDSDYLASFPVKDPDLIKNTVSQLLAASGYQELMTNSLTKDAYAEKHEGLDPAQNVYMLNALSADLNVMRQTMLFSGLEVVLHNINRRQTDLKLFEFGKTYHKKAEGGYDEQENLVIFLTGKKQEESWIEKTKPSDFHQLATAVQKVLGKLNFQDYDMEETEDKAFAYGLEYKSRKATLVKLGQLKPNLTDVLGIEQPIFYAEFDWLTVLKQMQMKVVYQQIPRFPEVRRDLSLVIDSSISFAEIKRLALRTERKLLKRINVFDVYEGKNLGEGKKSYSVSFILFDENSTLNDKVIDKTMNRLISQFERELGILIRR
ncbi:phenylalanine--tRNA ligase subunit beta [Flammeovirgaceae bacterium SG7u.111]|nr:phenylalanine--tRNA ligase subunit beta [Flammeovirgaceae bacterium SG7u.132]WPO35069.1 phenylalanine--tRNA ligase subunit beta [Flammeovirgaceae bacterium SG7u.111]